MKSFAPASEEPHNGTPASEQRDKEQHLREEMALEMEAEIRNFRESSLQDPEQVLS